MVSRFLWQVWSILGFTLLISTAAFSFLVTNQVERDALEQTNLRMLSQARALSPLLSSYLDNAQLVPVETIARLTPGVTARMTLISSEGIVIADNRSDPVGLENHRNRPEIITALSTGYGVSNRYSETLKQNMHYLAIRLQSELGKQGVLRLAIPSKFIENQMNNWRTRIAFSALLVGLLFLVIGYFLAYRITHPMTKITEVAASIAKGEYHLRLPENRVDELGQLSAVINELAQGAQARIDEITNNRNKLEVVLSGLKEGVIACDSEHTIVHINNSATGMLGIERKQVIGRNFEDVLITSELKQALRTCITEHTGVMLTIDIRGKTLICSCVEIEDEVDDSFGAIVIIEDVTERRWLEKVRTDFVASASHELKTPIAAIRGLIETIIDDPEMPGDVFARFSERIRQQTIRLDAIVQDLMQLSRFDSPEPERSMTEVELGGLLTLVHQAKSEDMLDAGVQINLQLSEEELWVVGETEALMQLVTNLVDNAIRYSDTESDKARIVKIHLSKIGEIARIEVEDNGIGIAQSETSRIFERFYTIDRARSRALGGTGLGLSIVKHIAEAHRGSVSVESQLGKGSIFRVQLPLVRFSQRSFV